MYGSFSMGSFVGVALLIALVVGLAFLASPLLAGFIFIIAAVVGLVAAASQRRRSEREDEQTRPPLTPEGQPTAPAGSRSGGAPASGEGEV